MPDDIMEQTEGPKKVKELAKKWDEFINSVESLKPDDVSFKNITNKFYTCFKDYIEGKNLSKFKKFKSKLGIIPSYTNKVLNAMYQSLEKCGKNRNSYLEKFDISGYQKIKTIREAAINNPKIQEKIKKAKEIIENQLKERAYVEKEKAVNDILKNMGKVNSYYDLYINLRDKFENIKCIDENRKKILLDTFSNRFNKCGLFNSETVGNIFKGDYNNAIIIPQYSELKKAAMDRADVIAKEEDKKLSDNASKVNKKLKESREPINYSYITSLFKEMFGDYISNPKLTGIDESIQNMYEEIGKFDGRKITTQNNKKYVKIISECREEELNDYKNFYQEFGKCIDLIKEKLNDSLPETIEMLKSLFEADK